MRRRWGTPFVVIALAAGCARGAPAPAFSEAARGAAGDSVAATIEAWRQAIVTRDTARIAAFYAPDSAFRWIEDGAVRYRTADQVVAAFKAMAGAVRAIDFTLDPPEITVLGPGAAVATTSFAQKLTAADGSVTGFAGAISLAVVHRPAGWQFLAGHTSSVVPTAAGGRAAKGG